MLRIGRVAKALETTPKTIRFYEKLGLLEPPERTEAGYRLYDEVAIRKAGLVLRLRRLGLSIDEVRVLLQGRGGLPTLRSRLRSLLDQKLSEMDLTLGVLQGRREDLGARYHALLMTPRDRVGECICGALMIPCSCGRSPDTAIRPVKRPSLKAAARSPRS
jgi:DNA-binding transcriptional MerR regulator